MSADEPSGLSPQRPAASPLVLTEGAVVAKRYELGPLISAGGQGAVYEALDRHSGRTRAVKLLLGHHLRDPKIVERFHREALMTAEIESEHLCEVLDAGVDERTAVPYIVMERLRGEDLGRHLERRGALPMEEAIALLRQAAIAIDKAHARGILHRDLKPENLFVSRRDDGSPRLRVLDFGIAKVLDGTSAPNTQVIGTPMYMAPEQLRAEARLSPAVDVFALGQIAFALLVGKPYWHEESALPVYAFLAQLLQGPRESFGARAMRIGAPVPPLFEAWMARTCADDPSGRYATATAAVEALAVALFSSRASESELAPLDACDDATELHVDPRVTRELEPASPAGLDTGPLPVLSTSGAVRAPLPSTSVLTGDDSTRASTTGGIASTDLVSRSAKPRFRVPVVAGVIVLLLASGVVTARHVAFFSRAAPAASAASAPALSAPIVEPVAPAPRPDSRPVAIEALPVAPVTPRASSRPRAAPSGNSSSVRPPPTSAPPPPVSSAPPARSPPASTHRID